MYLTNTHDECLPAGTDPVADRAPKRRSYHAFIISIGFVVLIALIAQVDGQAEDRARGDGTTHEQLGQEHFPHVELTPFESKVVYTSEVNRSSWGIKPVFRLAHALFDTTITDRPTLMPGYLMLRNGDTIALGSKVKGNDWIELLSEFWLLLIWVMFLVFLIIIIPFIGVCYCCFCCCRRCRKGCGPCDAKRDATANCICSIILLLLILLVLACIVIAFTSNRALDRGLDASKETLVRASDDTCRFLKDISDHIRHIFVFNYEELEAHLHDLLVNAHLHIFVDLGDRSKANAIEVLEQILENMNEARILMRQVDVLEKDLRFYGTQLRDGVRGAKRDVNYACANLIHESKCASFLSNSNMQLVDASPCLHLDAMPNTTEFVEGIEKIIKDKNLAIIKRALERFQKLGALIEVAMSHVIPELVRDVRLGRQEFEIRSTGIRNQIHNVVGKIHMRTLHSAQSFEDVYETFGGERSYLNAICCLLILTVLFALIMALIFSCCGRMTVGASCLLFAIIMIFCIFSFCLLVGLFYFMMGLLTYEGACAPLRDRDGNNLFRQLDATINLRSFLPQAKGTQHEPPLRMSKTIQHCMANESIFDLLQLNHLYNLENLEDIAIVQEKDDKNTKIFDEDLSKVYLLTKEEMATLNEMANAQLGPYHSILYLVNLCTPITPALGAISSQLRTIGNNISYKYEGDWWNRYGVYAMFNQATQFDAYNNQWTNLIHDKMDKMRTKVALLDKLILYNNLNFSNSIDILLNAILRSETFITEKGKEYINNLGVNLTEVINEQVDEFIQDLIKKSSTEIGRCLPLAYIYNRGVNHICYRLVDPMNGFWIGLILACLLLLPILFIAHFLMCLWKRMHGYAAPIIPIVHGCPTCTGAPYTPQPIVTCSGGQRTFAGAASFPLDTAPNLITIDAPAVQTTEQRNVVLPEVPPRKRKND